MNDEKLKEKLEKMPNIETFVSLSNDGKWVIEKVVITSIKPKSYFDKVFEGKSDFLFKQEIIE